MRILCVLILLVCPLSCLATTYAELAIGGGYECVILVSNTTAFAWRGAFYLYQGLDQPWVGTWSVVNALKHTANSFVATVPGNGTVKLQIKGDDLVRDGYLRMYGEYPSTTYDVTLTYCYQFYLDGKLVMSTNSVDSSLAHKTFYFPVEISPDANTGLAWTSQEQNLYPGTGNFSINVSLWRDDGSPILRGDNGSLVVSKPIQFNGHRSGFLQDFFPELAGANLRGFIILDAPTAFYLDVLRFDSSPNGYGYLVTNTPPYFQNH